MITTIIAIIMTEVAMFILEALQNPLLDFFQSPQSLLESESMSMHYHSLLVFEIMDKETNKNKD